MTLSPSPDNLQRERLRAAAEKTVPISEFDAAALRREVEATQADTVERTPEHYMRKTASERMQTGSADRTSTVTSFDESADVLPELASGEHEGKQRYTVVGQVGKGATSRVYAVEDRSLGRTMAVKFLRQTGKSQQSVVRKRFLHEARVTAMLEHPNIMPIHDIGTANNGQLYFSMKRVTGTTLGDAIRAAREGSAVPEEFRTIDGRVRIALKVCDALAYAHHKGFIHQDIKPDNIMLGEFGEVLLMDWGSALAVNEPQPGGRGMYGTPAYMSPEQARRERADERSDLYCLAATLFHALTLRHPTWSDNADTFWEKKRAGIVDPLTPQERRRIPRPLMAIVFKGLHPDPGRRYQRVSAFADDLKRWQAGQAVSAYRENLGERFVRWYRSNWRLFWTSAAASTAVLGIGTLLFREKLLEMVTWQRLFDDDFSRYTSTAGLSANWRAWFADDWWNSKPEPFSDSAHWKLVDGAVEGTFHNGFANLTYAHVVPGNIRVEWTVTPLVMNLNLNCYIAGETRNDGYTFHVGGFRNDPTQCFLTRQRNFQPIDSGVFSPPIEVGKACRLRMEKEGRHVRFYKDGRLVIDYEDMDEISGPGHQTFGFEACYYNRLRLDDVRVYYHPLPRKVSPLATADRFFAAGYYADALSHYREVAVMYPRSDLAANALYKAGLCLSLLDSVPQALRTFSEFELTFPRHRRTPFSLYERSRILERAGDTAAANELLRRLGRTYPGHTALRMVLNDITNRRIGPVQDSLNAGMLARDPTPQQVAWLEGEVQAIRQWADAFRLNCDGNPLTALVLEQMANQEVIEFDELIRKYPEQRQVQYQVLRNRERSPQVLAGYADVPGATGSALLAMGRWEEVLNARHCDRITSADALLELNRLQEVLERYPEQFSTCAKALWRLGRLEEAMERYPLQVAELYRRLGRHRQFLERIKGSSYDVALYLIYPLGRPDSALAIITAMERSPESRYGLRIHESLRELGRLDDAFAAVPEQVVLRLSKSDALCRAGRFQEALAFDARRPRTASRTLSAMGLFDSALTMARDNTYARDLALWRSGRLQAVLDANPGNRFKAAAVYIHLGDYERVVRYYADQRPWAARALYLLGRYDEVLAQYPDQRDVCGLALLASGREREALERFPDCRPEYARYLVENARYIEVADSFADQTMPYAAALVALGRYDDLPISKGLARLIRRDLWDTRALMALREHRLGNRRTADSLLRTLERPDYGWLEQRFGALLLRPILRGLAGDTSGMRRLCEQIAASHPWHYGQCLRYEALMLAGMIGRNEFLAQPSKLESELRAALIEAIRADIRGRRKEALAAYEALRRNPKIVRAELYAINDQPSDFLTGMFGSYTLYEFLRWRCEALAAAIARAP